MKQRPSKPLTARQREILSDLEEYIGQHNFPPSVRELSERCRLGSPSRAHRVLHALERKGYIVRTSGLSRAFTVVLPPADYSVLPPLDRGLMCATFLLQSAQRDRVLRAAFQSSDIAVKSALIRDAFERHAVLVELNRGLAGVADELSRTRQELSVFLRALRADVDWPTFVVEHLILNRSSALGGTVLAEEAPFVQGLFVRLARICQRAAGDAEVWLADIVRDTRRATDRERLRKRAAAMVGACLKTVRVAGGERRQFLSKLALEYEKLPDILRPWHARVTPGTSVPPLSDRGPRITRKPTSEIPSCVSRKYSFLSSL